MGEWKLIETPYELIVDISIPQGKGSEELLLSMKDGSNLLMLVTGREGRFSDSMAMVQFLGRVLEDLSEN